MEDLERVYEQHLLDHDDNGGVGERMHGQTRGSHRRGEGMTAEGKTRRASTPSEWWSPEEDQEAQGASLGDGMGREVEVEAGWWLATPHLFEWWLFYESLSSSGRGSIESEQESEDLRVLHEAQQLTHRL